MLVWGTVLVDQALLAVTERQIAVGALQPAVFVRQARDADSRAANRTLGGAVRIEHAFDAQAACGVTKQLRPRTIGVPRARLQAHAVHWVARAILAVTRKTAFDATLNVVRAVGLRNVACAIRVAAEAPSRISAAVRIVGRKRVEDAVVTSRQADAQ